MCELKYYTFLKECEAEDRERAEEIAEAYEKHLAEKGREDES